MTAITSEGWVEDHEKRIATRIRRLREAMGLSVPEFARRVNMDAEELQRYEDVKEPVSAAALFYISLMLGISVESFYKEEEALFSEQAREGITVH